MTRSTFISKDQIREFDESLNLFDRNPELESKYWEDLMLAEEHMAEWFDARRAEALQHLASIAGLPARHFSGVASVLSMMFYYGLAFGEMRWEGKHNSLAEFRNALEDISPDTTFGSEDEFS